MDDLIIKQVISAINNRHKPKDGNGPSSQEILTKYLESYKLMTNNDERIVGLDISKITYENIFNKDGNIILKAMVLRADVVSDKWVVGVHGYSASKESVLMSINYYRKLGYNIFSFDFRNHGESDDGYITMGLNEISDLKAALNHLKENYAPKSVGLVGFSMGAFTCNYFNLLDENKKYNIDWVVSDSTYYNQRDVLARVLKYIIPIELFNDKILDFTIKYYKEKLNYDIESISLEKAINSCKKSAPTLFICSKADQVTLYSESYRLMDDRKKFKQNDKIVDFETTEHVAASIQKTDLYCKSIDEFFSKL
ncbi:alpha/beta hydrolase [Spiroplasma endosymbiont of Aspidapion aeneum]|uniref:alpha/beta hydrolase n=1 Tax=Spiroplasma endosymbiont of Aspidapion aeneum TaxID=3066276 RepID=UPI00313D90C2